jgi:hypothetical protein
MLRPAALLAAGITERRHEKDCHLIDENGFRHDWRSIAVQPQDGGPAGKPVKKPCTPK